MRAKHLLHSTLLSGALTLSATASAADFRVLDFDAPCEQIESLEQARGSKTYDGKLPSGYHFAFRVREMDRDALAVYACDAGKFFRGATSSNPRTKPMPRRCTQPSKSASLANSALRPMTSPPNNIAKK
jgi:hypothetical protein